MKTLVKIFPLFLLITALTSCNNYGTKLEFDGTEIYYTENVTEEDAQKLGDFLVEEHFTDGNKKSIQLDKKNDLYLFKMVAKKGLEIDDRMTLIFKDFARKISEKVFDNKKIEIHICDNTFETKQVIEM